MPERPLPAVPELAQLVAQRLAVRQLAQVVAPRLAVRLMRYHHLAEHLEVLGHAGTMLFQAGAQACNGTHGASLRIDHRKGL